MTVTLKDLSKASGVSVGTVSRALNDKSEVSEDTAKRIRQLAQELGYVPNRAGRALSAQKNLNTVGILLPSINSPFFDDIKHGIRQAELEFKDLGLEVILREVEGWDVDEHLSSLMQLKEQGCKSLALCTVDDPRIRAYINDLSDSNIPVILMSSLLAIVSMVTLLLYSNDFLSGIPLIGGNEAIGYFESGSTTAAGGLAWYLSAPQGLTDWLMPILDPAQYGNGHNAIQNIAHVAIYFTVMVMGSIMFAKFWVETTNLGPESVANQIQRSGMQIPGFRRDPRVLKRVLERYIPTITILSGALVGGLAAFADMIGTTGNASGTGVLLTVGILIHFYEAMGREQMMEMNPVMRGFFGSE